MKLDEYKWTDGKPCFWMGAIDRVLIIIVGPLKKNSNNKNSRNSRSNNNNNSNSNLFIKRFSC